MVERRGYRSVPGLQAAIANEMITRRGVLTGRLHQLAAVIPPLQAPGG